MASSFAKSALKVLLGLVFVVSAVLKLVDMDKFEIYVYSYHFFSLNASFIVARIAIILEIVLGIGLVSHGFHRLMWWGSMAMLGFYTLLLMYALIVGRSDSCHCFGEFLPLNPMQSLIKNAALMLLFLLIYRMESSKASSRWWVLCLAVVVSTIGVFVASPPDNFTPSYSPERHLQVELFDEMLDATPFDSLHLKEGKQVVCLFTTGCEYCQMAARKLSLMQQFYGFPADRVTYVFMGNGEGLEQFYERSASARYRNVLVEDVRNMLNSPMGISLSCCCWTMGKWSTNTVSATLERKRFGSFASSESY